MVEVLFELKFHMAYAIKEAWRNKSRMETMRTKIDSSEARNI
jgi:hypothetical protein